MSNTLSSINQIQANKQFSVALVGTLSPGAAGGSNFSPAFFIAMLMFVSVFKDSCCDKPLYDTGHLSHHGDEEGSNCGNSSPQETFLHHERPTENVTRAGKIVPDRGYAWVIVVASFFNAFIFDGIGSSYGVLYPYIIEKYQASAFLTSFGSSMFGAYLIMGVVTTALIKMTSFRLVSVCGGLLGSIALFASAHCPNIYLFLLCFGVLGGISVGLVYLTSTVIVNHYFDKKRGIANGIISSGSGAGLFVMAPLTNHLLHTYSLSGALWILGGIMLNMCMFSALFRSPSLYNTSDINTSHGHEACMQDDDVEDTGSETLEDMDTGWERREDTDTGWETLEDTDTGWETLEDTDRRGNKRHEQSTDIMNKNSSMNDVYDRKTLGECIGRSENTLDEYSSTNLSTIMNVFTQSRNLSLQSIFDRIREKSKIGQLSGSFSDIGTKPYRTGNLVKLITIPGQYTQTTKPDSQSNIGEFGGGKYCETNDDIYLSRIGSSNNKIGPPEKDNQQAAIHRNIDSLGFTIYQLLKLQSFHLFWMNACLIQIGYHVPGTFLADMALAHGISSYDSAYIISSIGACNMLGRFTAGWLADRGHDPAQLINVALLLAATLCFFSPLYTSLWTLGVFAALYGFLLGFFPPLQPLVIVKYFGIGSLASAFGVMTTLKGVANLMGSPVAGRIYDVSHNYSISIIFAGAAFLLSFILGEAMILVQRRQRRIRCGGVQSKKKAEF